MRTSIRPFASLAVFGLMLAASSAPAETPEEDSPWVCVPTEDFGWRCGRGHDAPEQSPLPEPPPPAPPPEGYVPPHAESSLPDYLRQPERAGQTAPPGETKTHPGQGAAQPPERNAREPEPTSEPAERAAEAQSSSPAPGPRYGIQLTAGRSPDSLDTFLQRHEFPESDVYRRRWDDAGGTWYVLLTGRYPSVSSARRALAGLPDDVRQAGAWVRRVDTLETIDDSKPDNDDSSRD